MKKFFRAKICVPAPLVATTVLTQNKGPGTEAHFWNPPPLLCRAPMPSPPPPTPAKQFSGRPMLCNNLLASFVNTCVFPGTGGGVFHGTPRYAPRNDHFEAYVMGEAL